MEADRSGRDRVAEVLAAREGSLRPGMPASQPAGALDTPSEPSPPQPPPEPERFEWVVHPYTRARARGLLVLAAIAGIGALAALAFGSAVPGAVAALLLFASTHAFYVPTRYVVEREGLSLERLGGRARHPWSGFRSMERSGARMWLSRHRAGTWAARLRSVCVELPDNGDGEEVFRYVQARIPGARS